jgi:hypothetical protein
LPKRQGFIEETKQKDGKRQAPDGIEYMHLIHSEAYISPESFLLMRKDKFWLLQS